MSTRTPFVAGNWKMNTDRAGALRLAMDVAEGCATIDKTVEAALLPPFVYLDPIGRALVAANSTLGLGAQDLYFQPSGAFTGEISAAMLIDVRCRFVLTGHSERRHVLGEADDLIAKKTRAALDAGLQCILCVGETIDQRKGGQTDAVNQSQLGAVLPSLSADALTRLTIAYEPVWAIGTGVTASPDDAQKAHAHIRGVVGELTNPALAGSVRILYGGSVKSSNASTLFSQPDIDGGLIGGASLEAGEFLAIIRAAGV